MTLAEQEAEQQAGAGTENVGDAQHSLGTSFQYIQNRFVGGFR
jgi:hypothetical protein